MQKNNQPFHYVGKELTDVTVEDVDRLFEMRDFLKREENSSLNTKQFFAMLKGTPKFLKTAMKYPNENFVADLIEHGPVYIAIAISDREVIDAKGKEADKKWKVFSNKQDKERK